MSQPGPVRCAIYTRKSTDKGLEQAFNSLDAQREACEAYVRSQMHQGWQLVPGRYDDGGFTGANIDRPAFQRLLADIDAGQVDVVVVYKVDRLSRSLLDFAQVMDRFSKGGAAFVSITQNFSTADAMGRLTLNVLMSFAEFEREMIAERTRDKIAASRRKGQWTGGRPPLGYRIENKRLVVDELEAVLARDIFRLYLEHRSALAVAASLNAEGRPPKRHRSRTGTAQKTRCWSKNLVLSALRNPVLAGLIPCGDELHEGEHTAVIDRETFQRVQSLLAAHPAQVSRAGRNPDYILAGVLRCGSCGMAYTPASTRPRGKAEYRYYRCVTRDKRGRQACPSRPLPAEAIEDIVVARIREATADGRLAAEVTERLTTQVAHARDAMAAERRALPTAIASAAAEAHRLLETLANLDGAARGLLETRVQELSEEVAQHEARLAEINRQLADLAETQVEAEWVAESLRRFDLVWDLMTPENRGRLLRGLVQRVEVDEPGNNVKVILTNLEAPVPDATAPGTTVDGDDRT